MEHQENKAKTLLINILFLIIQQNPHIIIRLLT